MTRDYWGSPYDGAKHPDAPEPGDYRHEPDDDRERFDPQAEASPAGPWPDKREQDES